MTRALGAAALLALFFCSGCVTERLAKADSDISDKITATPPVLAAFGNEPVVTGLSEWKKRRSSIMQALGTEIYGPMPSGIVPRLIRRLVIEDRFAGGSGRLEEITIALSDAPDAPKFVIALALPIWASEERPAPVILAQNFCDNPSMLGIESLSPPEPEAVEPFCDSDGFLSWLLSPIFSNLFTFPLQMMLERGFAVAAYSPRDIVPDSPHSAGKAMRRIGALADPGSQPEGIIAVWAQSYSWAFDILAADSRLDANRIAFYGHSRHGKAALLAGAVDQRVAAIVSHQSGTGGAALSRDLVGESIGQVTESYPHWFARRFAIYHGREDALPVDQHHLIALIAPRPVLIGNAWRDTWSGPNETFRAMQGGDPAWRLYGSAGLTQKDPTDKDTTGTLFYYIRGGLHGHTRSDWRAFMDFLDRVFPQGSAD